MPTLYDVAVKSPVHQILLVNGAINKIPTAKIDRLRAQFSGEYTLWTEELIVELLQTEFEPRVLEAYNSLKPLAFKADLARYCIIYARGGWYFDLLMSVLDADVLRNLPVNREAILFRDIPFTDNPIAISNTVFWFRNHGSILLKNLINRVVSNILNKNYGPHAHSVTGPIAFGAEVALQQIEAKRYTYAIGDTQMIDNRPSHVFNLIELENTLVFSQRRAMNEEFRHLVPKGYEAGSTYFNMWNARDIFK
jgi:mannosyltransferase OCH1-like enzyme